jgi:hypothetical protein
MIVPTNARRCITITITITINITITITITITIIIIIIITTGVITLSRGPDGVCPPGYGPFPRLFGPVMGS